MMQDDNGNFTHAIDINHPIASLRPPKIPVTLNRCALIQRDSNAGDCLALLKVIHSADFGTGIINAEKMKKKKDLTRAHRGLESLCDKLWLRQNEMYLQLCRYHKLKREAARRVYQLEQEELRKGRQINVEKTPRNRIASFGNVFTSLDDSHGHGVWLNESAADGEPPLAHDSAVVGDGEVAVTNPMANESNVVLTLHHLRSLSNIDQLHSNSSSDEGTPNYHIPTILPSAAHLDTILTRENADNVRLRGNHGNAVEGSFKFVRSYTDGNQLTVADKLPPITEGRELSFARPPSNATFVTQKLPYAYGKFPATWHQDKRDRERDAIERKILEEPFTVYRRNERGDFVPRETMPLAFNTERPSNKNKYKRLKLLEKERVKLQLCLNRAATFRPVLHGITLKEPDEFDFANANTSESNNINYEYSSW